MHWLDFFALAVAAGVPVEAWLHPGGILEDWRERVTVWGEPDEGEGRLTRYERFRARVAQLANCYFCQSHWTPAVLLLVFYVPSQLTPEPWSWILRLPLYSLAATRISILIGHLRVNLNKDTGLEDGDET